MGSFANTLFTVLLGWFRGIIAAVWSAFTSEQGGNLLEWIGKHWLIIASFLCIIGLTADFTVYLFRWKPLRVWKSFFRRRQMEDENGDSKFSDTKVNTKEAAQETGRYFSSIQYQKADDLPEKPFNEPEDPGLIPLQEDSVQEDPFSRNRNTETEEPSREEPQEGALVTSAGYYVPADSPYRRPSDDTGSGRSRYRKPENGMDINLPYPEPIHEERRQETVPVLKKRRRRLRMGDLFTDPEEDLQEFDAPQHLIDQRQAYHKPVYPRGWKNNEEDTE